METTQATRRIRPRRHIPIVRSDDEGSDSLGKIPLPCDSRSYLEGALQSLENSQASLNKRLASVAGLDGESGPTDFGFWLTKDMSPDHGEKAQTEKDCEAEGSNASDYERGASTIVKEPASFQDVVDILVAKEPPAFFYDQGIRWVNSNVSKGSDLIDGQAWIAEFQRRLDEAKAHPANATMRELPLRNRVLKEMAAISPPGHKVQLSTGHEVIFWFNVGAPGPPRSRVHVTEAQCPHQGVCLLGSELMEIEDLASGRRALTRCPRHNKRFDLVTGESTGNSERLQHYPCRFEHGRWYVGIEEQSHNAAAPEHECKVGFSKENDGMVTKVARPLHKKARLSSRIVIENEC